MLLYINFKDLIEFIQQSMNWAACNVTNRKEIQGAVPSEENFIGRNGWDKEITSKV